MSEKQNEHEANLRRVYAQTCLNCVAGSVVNNERGWALDCNRVAVTSLLLVGMPSKAVIKNNMGQYICGLWGAVNYALRVSDDPDTTCVDCAHFYYHKWEVSQVSGYGRTHDRREPMCEKLDFSWWEEPPQISAGDATCGHWEVSDDR